MQSITELYAQFETAVAAAHALPEIPAGQSTEPFDRAIDKCSKIAWRIVKAPAQGIDEMKLKIAVAGWCMGAGDKNWHPGGLIENEEAYALATLREDLRRLQAA